MYIKKKIVGLAVVQEATKTGKIPCHMASLPITHTSTMELFRSPKQTHDLILGVDE